MSCSAPVAMTATPVFTRPPTALSPSTGERPRVAPLDGLRGVAILLVMLYHLPMQGGGRIARDIAILGRCGWVGVDLFFVLSGFLITGILYDAKERDGYLRRFYLARVLRIFPLYFAALIVCFALLPALHLVRGAAEAGSAARGSAWWFFLYLQNVRMAINIHSVPPYMQHFWSLAIEEQFYLIWPFVVLACSRERLIRLTLGAVAAAVLLRMMLVAGRVDPLTLYVLTPTRLDGLALGAYVALVARGPRVSSLRWLRAAGAAALLLLGFFVWRDHALNILASRSLEVIGYTLVSLAAAAALEWALRARLDSIGGRIASSRLLVWLGRRSYGIYVIHFPVFLLLQADGFTLAALARRLGSWSEATIGFLLVAGGLTLLLTVLSWRLLEAPALRLRHRLGAPRAVAADG